MLVQPALLLPSSAQSSKNFPGVPGFFLLYAVGNKVSMELYTCSGIFLLPDLVVSTTSKVTSELRWCLNSIALPSGNIVTDRLKMSNVLWERAKYRDSVPTMALFVAFAPTPSFRHS